MGRRRTESHTSWRWLRFVAQLSNILSQCLHEAHRLQSDFNASRDLNLMVLVIVMSMLARLIDFQIEDKLLESSRSFKAIKVRTSGRADLRMYRRASLASARQDHDHGSQCHIASGVTRAVSTFRKMTSSQRLWSNRQRSIPALYTELCG